MLIDPNMTLKQYRSKRSFKNTPEPPAKLASHPSSKESIFCVQEHHASHLHYDFRLEYQGVLLSWAVPKGPSANPQDKRLAVKVEDHPFDYWSFEGTIPKGNYGAGEVILWDSGTYVVPGTYTKAENENAIGEGLKKGKLTFELHGKKLKGRFGLIHIKKDEKSWLLIKEKEDYTSDASETKSDSVNPTENIGGEILKTMPSRIKPMLATLIDSPFDAEDWLFEIKWDGYRSLAYLKKNKVDLLSRNNLSFNANFPEIIKDLSSLTLEAILDGEIVLLDEKGKADFQLMQNYKRTGKGTLCYYVFDILYLNNHDLRKLPLLTRKAYLKKIIDSSSLKIVRYSDHVRKEGKKIFKEAVKNQLEGIIGKQIDSSYTSTRSSNWVKIKAHMMQEAVIAGFTPPKGSRPRFGALVLGVYENQDLIYIGNTGSGFTVDSLNEIYEKLKPFIQENCPFKTRPKSNATTTWVKPQLVCEISLSEWTQDGNMRHPIFQGLRIDKDPKEVKREKMQSIDELPIKTNNPTLIKNGQSPFSNLKKIFWPDQKYTKGDLIKYYQETAHYILPYLKNRPVMMHRFPEGINGKKFYQKDSSPMHPPEWVKTLSILQQGKQVQYILIQDLRTLEYVVNLGSIEIHSFFSCAGHLENPDYLVIDLDPVDISFEKVIEAAQTVHDVLEEIKVPCFCKTSGAKGLHICIPIHAKYTFEQTKQFGRIIVTWVHQKIPSITSLERRPINRQKKVYLDVDQNNLGQTLAVPYSVRARPFAPVSTPLEWKEVTKGLNPTDFNIKTVPDRLKKLGDIFKPVLGKGIDIKKILKNMS